MSGKPAAAPVAGLTAGVAAGIARVDGAAASALRIRSMLLRYLFLHRRSLIRAFDIVFWPVMDLLVWGFVTIYVQKAIQAPGASIMLFFIGAMISWDIHYRGQQAVTISFMEEIWNRNLTNILISPIRLWEWIVATFCYAAIRIVIVIAILATVAHVLYAFDLARAGWAFLPLAALLLLFGWGIGLFTTGLLLRFGYAAEALIWGIPFLVQPFSCVFYPVSVLPRWAQMIARCLPSTYAFEGLRMALAGQPVPASIWLPLIGLDALAFGAGIAFFVGMFRAARKAGRLGRLAHD